MNTEICIHDGAIWWEFWHTLNSWDCSTPVWRKGCWYPLDTFLGKQKYSKREFDSKDIEIPMPEKPYSAKAIFEECTWKRPLWFAKRIIRVDIDIPDGIPVPGKGENDWDCGEDAIYRSSLPANTVAEAIGKVVESAMRQRIKYGGMNWRPSKEGAQPTLSEQV
jgi:hypothetical protein